MTNLSQEKLNLKTLLGVSMFQTSLTRVRNVDNDVWTIETSSNVFKTWFNFSCSMLQEVTNYQISFNYQFLESWTSLLSRNFYVHTRAKFTFANKVEANMYERLWVNVKLNQAEIWRFIGQLFIHWLYFIYALKFYSGIHVKITRRWKSTLTPFCYVCEAVPGSLFWAFNGLDQLPKVRFEFLFNLIGKSTMTF